MKLPAGIRSIPEGHPLVGLVEVEVGVALAVAVAVAVGVEVVFVFDVACSLLHDPVAIAARAATAPTARMSPDGSRHSMSAVLLAHPHEEPAPQRRRGIWRVPRLVAAALRRAGSGRVTIVSAVAVVGLRLGYLWTKSFFVRHHDASEHIKLNQRSTGKLER
jgi:hypothetical protein